MNSRDNYSNRYVIIRILKQASDIYADVVFPGENELMMFMVSTMMREDCLIRDV